MRRSPGRQLLSRFRVPLLLVAAALVYGTIGFLLIERVSPLDALYQTVLVLSTIGAGTPEPRGAGAKIFTISLILVGVAAVFAGIGVGTETLVSGELGNWARRRRMTSRLGRLSGHFVVCAYGRVGRTVIAELRAQGSAVVVIESDPELEPALAEQRIPHVVGDPSDEQVRMIPPSRPLSCVRTP